MNEIKLIDIIGKSLSDESIIKLVSFMGKDPAKLKIKRGEPIAIIDNDKLGLQLTFSYYNYIETCLFDPDIEQSPALAERIEYMKYLPEGTLFLTDIDIDQKNNIEVNKLLPEGLSFDNDKNNVYKILGEPNLGESEKFNTAGWIFDYYIFAARFTKGNIFYSFGVSFIDNSHLED